MKVIAYVFARETTTFNALKMSSQNEISSEISFQCSTSTQHTKPKPIVNQIPDDEDLQYDEDFEQQYAEELQLLHNIENEYNESLVAQLEMDSEPSVKEKQLPNEERAVNRCLFPMSQVVEFDSMDILPVTPQSEGLRAATNKRRLERDLFGNIDDLYINEDYEDQEAKKARTEEEKDMELIEKLLHARKVHKLTTKAPIRDELHRLQELYAFKKTNLSLTVPAYPSLPLLRSNRQRIFVRFHNDEYENRALQELNANTQVGSILLKNREQMWAEAQQIINNRLSALESQQNNATTTPQVTARSGKSWVDKYKPQKYIDLLSDETANRSLLTWLKMWDKIVFGRVFKTREMADVTAKKLNTFNKQTGKFETGGWATRNKRLNLNLNVDEYDRPMQKIALLYGPPGVGKTTLAHVIARHAGYEVREINASDDRSPEAFKMALENGTEMTSVLNANKRPNCIILDEIDGAPKRSIDFLLNYIADSVKKVKGRAGKSTKKILKRPIICICNDLYAPALRVLRQVALVVSFPSIDTARLAERLQQIATREKLQTNFSTLFALSEKLGNDVRSCITTMQFFKARDKKFTLQNVLNENLGQKDRHQGLFDIWNAIFRIHRTKTGMGNANESNKVMSIQQRVQNVQKALWFGADYDMLSQGVYENLLQQKMPDLLLNGPVNALEWFCFNDLVQQQINIHQNYVLYPFLQYAFIAWHLSFGTLTWPKITFPSKAFEFRQKLTTHQHIYQSYVKNLLPIVLGGSRGTILLLDVISPLKKILVPTLRTVPVALFSQREKSDLTHTIDVMLDFGVTFIQVKAADGQFIYVMEPELDNLCNFPEITTACLSYYLRQLIAREVEIRRMQCAAPKLKDATKTKTDTPTTSKTLPNHLQKLQPKPLNIKENKVAVSKDIFGRVIKKSTPNNEDLTSSQNTELKSDVIFVYKEGFNNAVRKTILMKNLI